jgi:hypothetical protein
MATDAQQSGPLPGTGPAAKFTQGLWTKHNAIGAGVTGDTDGTAFNLTLPPDGNTAEVGSATIDSIAKVGGFPLIIPAGTTQSLEIPASSNGTTGRTDLIVARFAPGEYTTSPGPVRLERLEGTEGSESAPTPTVSELPLYAVTRKQGQSLNQATVVDLRPRAGWNYLVPAGGSLPTSVPLGARAVRDGRAYRRDLVAGSVDWVLESRPPELITGTAALAQFYSNWQGQVQCSLVREHDTGRRTLTVVARRTTQLQASSWGNLDEVQVARVFNADRPMARTPMAATVRTNTTAGPRALAGAHMEDSGIVYLNSMLPNAVIGPSGPNDTFTATATWFVAPTA